MSLFSVESNRVTVVSGAPATSPLSHFLGPTAPAGVAFQMINLAITAQHARGQGCWEGGDSHSRAQQQEFAEKPEDAWRPTCLCGKWTLELRMCGQPSFGGCGRWTPTVRWSPIGSGHDTCVSSPGRRSARRKKARTDPELVAAGARARLVVLALEVGGRWSQEASTFVKLLAKAKVRSEPAVVQRRMEQAWRLRWSSILAWVVARVFPGSLLGLRGGQGVDGQVPQFARG